MGKTGKINGKQTKKRENFVASVEVVLVVVLLLALPET